MMSRRYDKMSRFPRLSLSDDWVLFHNINQYNGGPYSWPDCIIKISAITALSSMCHKGLHRVVSDHASICAVYHQKLTAVGSIPH